MKDSLHADASHPWPLIVVGGGMAGLTAALAWTVKQPDAPALVLESQPHVGGYVTSYTRKGHRFDTCQMTPDLRSLLGLLGVDVPVRPIAVPVQVVRVDPATGERRVFAVPGSQEALMDAVASAFPSQEIRFRRFLTEARSFYGQLIRLKLQPGFFDVMGMFTAAPGILRFGSSTFEAWFRRFGIDDPLLLDVIGAFVEMAALPAREVHALVPISVLCSLLDGAWRPMGPFSDLPSAMERRLFSLGGCVRTSARVERILVEGGRVRGVRLAGGEEVRAERVVATIEPGVLARDLVGSDILDSLDARWTRKATGAKMSWSSFNLNLGLDCSVEAPGLDLGAGYTVLTTGGETLTEAFDACGRGENVLRPDRFHLGFSQPDPCALTIRVYPLPMGGWTALRRDEPARYRAEKARLGSLFEEILDRFAFPDLGRHIEVRDISSPATYARYSGSPSGAIYDMAPTVANFGRTRLRIRTPVEGLLTPHFVHGVLGAVLSGFQAADLLLDGDWMGGRAMPGTCL